MKQRNYPFAKLQRVLAALLCDLNVSREALAGIMLILKYDVQRQKKWILWLYHNHPTEDEIMARLIKETEARQTKCK